LLLSNSFGQKSAKARRSSAMSLEENKDLIRRYIEAIDEHQTATGESSTST
jgi:hypothetical protein